ncbi:MAG TPA: threonine ammonia-lyase IlvA [Mucilaginibacter sp.]|nr:threonine ammonia-lyase IlvA [Mucilaginibacter sp.]
MWNRKDTLTEQDFESAYANLKNVVKHTPLELSPRLSERFNAEIYLKREDLQWVRSYKLRGAYHMISSLPQDVLSRGVVCASAGNHAQGVAFACRKKQVNGVVFMPEITPKQKIRQTEMFGKGNVTVILKGDTFDDCKDEALAYAHKFGTTFIPPFDNRFIIAGQGTVGMEIWEDLPDADMVIVPVGGGGLAAGVGAYLKRQRPDILLLGAEPEGAPSMKAALKNGSPVALEKIDTFVDGAAVKCVGELTYAYCARLLDDIKTVAEGSICTAILNLYNEDGIVAEPAGALSVAALERYSDRIRRKKVVCVVSGGNNDIDRMPGIKERSLLYDGLKHYFIIKFPQRPGALRAFVNEVLGPDDDITRFEFIKKNERESGPALVGIELKNAADYSLLRGKMEAHRLSFVEVNNEHLLFDYLI